MGHIKQTAIDRRRFRPNQTSTVLAVAHDSNIIAFDASHTYLELLNTRQLACITLIRSYLGEGVELHHNYVGDSVMADGTSMGFGGTTANFRLDGRTVPSMVAGQRVDSGREKFGAVLGRGAKLGVNTSLMPGIKIGAGAIIGPNLRINKDVPAGERVMYDDEYGRF